MKGTRLMDKNNKLINNKGFYIALCTSIAIISAAAYICSQPTPPQEQKTLDSVEVAESTPDTKPIYPVSTPIPAITATPYKSTPKPASKPAKATTVPVKSASTATIADETPIPTENPTPTLESNFTNPLTGKIIGTYSDGALIYNKDLEDWRSHDGIDIAGELGSDVCAVYDGTICEISYTINGKTIKIDHNNGYVSVYANLADDIKLKSGDKVSKGDIIGKIGNTSICEKFIEPHLHFELIENGKFINPIKFIK